MIDWACDVHGWNGLWHTSDRRNKGSFGCWGILFCTVHWLCSLMNRSYNPFFVSCSRLVNVLEIKGI
jgi:hypothetical protein